MLYPPSFLERLRSHVLLSELIGRRMPLKKHGREYQGLCPFHGEKTPSFTVNNEKGFYHCFGCAAHGDAIEFVKRFDRLNYREAIEKLARESGIPLPVLDKETEQREQRRKTLYDVMDAACTWFEHQLSDGPQFVVRDYVKSRGLTQETQAKFRIGFAPDGRDMLKRALLAKGFTDEQLIECGLVIKPENGQTYDRFRARLMFPIRAGGGGSIIAFGGRLVSNAPAAKHLPKYLNSPETSLFKKGEVLFNLDQAGKFAREKQEIIIVEGYMDVIALVQAGIPNVVATLGTAVTEEHMQKLWHYAPIPTMCLDGDAAGARAMLRAAELVLPFLKPGHSLKFVQLPSGEDPDSFVRARGTEAFSGLLAQATSLSETLWKQAAAHSGSSAEARAGLEHTLFALTDRIKDPTVKSHYRTYFKNQLWSTNTRPARKDKQATPQRPRSREVEMRAMQSADEVSTQTARTLLKLLLIHPALLESARVEDYVLHMEHLSPALDRLRQTLLTASATGHAEDAGAVQAALEEAGLTHAASAIMKDVSLPKAAIASLEAARDIWDEMIKTERVSAMEQEYRNLQHAMQGELNEETYARFIALQQEIKMLKLNKKSADSGGGEGG